MNIKIQVQAPAEDYDHVMTVLAEALSNYGAKLTLQGSRPSFLQNPDLTDKNVWFDGTSYDTES